MIGRIDRIFENKKEDRKYWVLSIGGENYSVWKPELMEGIEQGGNVDYTFTTKGKFRNIATLQPTDQDPDSPTSPVENQLMTNISQKNLLSSPYTVPAGKNLVILNIWSGGTPHSLLIDGIAIDTGATNEKERHSLGQPIFVAAEQELTSNTDENLSFNGYLISRD